MAGESGVHPDWSPVARRIRDEATDTWNDKVAVSPRTLWWGYPRDRSVRESEYGQLRFVHITSSRRRSQTSTCDLVCTRP